MGVIIGATFFIGFLYFIATLFSGTYLPIKLYYTGVEKTTIVTKKTVVTSSGYHGSPSSVTYLKCSGYDFDILTHRWSVKEEDTIKVLVNTTANYGVHYKNRKTFFRVLWHSETSYFVFILLMLFALFALIALIVNVYYYVRKVRLISKLSVRKIARQIPGPKTKFRDWRFQYKMVLYIRTMRHLLPFVLSFILIILIYKMVMTGIIYSEATDKYHFVLGLALLLGVISIAFLPFKLAIW